MYKRIIWVHERYFGCTQYSMEEGNKINNKFLFKKILFTFQSLTGVRLFDTCASMRLKILKLDNLFNNWIRIILLYKIAQAHPTSSNNNKKWRDKKLCFR